MIKLLYFLSLVSLGSFLMVAEAKANPFGSEQSMELTQAITTEKPEDTSLVEKIDNIAEQITVRIDNLKDNSNGSGVIIARQGDTYYVLTAAHVVEKEQKYQIKTPDGQFYPVDYQSIEFPQEWLDLAIVRFKSNKKYEVATLANHKLEIEFYDLEHIYFLSEDNKNLHYISTSETKTSKLVFLSGFPKSLRKSKRILTIGENHSFNFRDIDYRTKSPHSSISLNAIENDNSILNYNHKSKGYTDLTLLSTNISYPGMSGGAILNSFGELIGINIGSEQESYTEDNDTSFLAIGYSLGISIKSLKTFIQDLSLEENNLLISNRYRLSDNYSISTHNIKVNHQYRLKHDGNSPAIKKRLLDNLIEKNKPNEKSTLTEWFNYGSMLWRLRDNKNAIKIFDKITNQHPDFHQAHYIKGLISFDLGDLKQAVAAFKEATRLQENDPSYWRWLGKAYINSNKMEESISAYQTAIEKPQVDFIPYLELGIILSEQRKINQAINIFNEGLKVKNHPLIYLNKAYIYEEQGRIKQAIENYNSVIAYIPYHEKSLLYLCTLYSQLDDSAKLAIETCSDYINFRKPYPGSQLATSYATRGQAYLQLNKYNKAISDFDTALNKVQTSFTYLNPQKKEHRSYQLSGNENFNIYRNNKLFILNNDDEESYQLIIGISLLKTQIYSEQNKYSKALESANIAVNYSKKLANSKLQSMPYMSRAIIYENLKEYDKAINDYTKVIDIFPQELIFYLARGKLYFEQKEYDEAIADFTQVLKLDPQSADAYDNRGHTYFYLGQYEKAIADYGRALSFNPQNEATYYNRGIAHNRIGQDDKAIADYTQAIKLHPYYANAFFNRGNTYSVLKQDDKAIADYTQAIKFNPQNAFAYNNRGNAYNTRKQYDKAIADLTKAIKLNPQNALAYNNRGNTYFALKQYDKAITDYTQAIKFNPHYAKAYNNRGATYKRLKKYDLALADYTQAIKLDPHYKETFYDGSNVYLELKQYKKAIVNYYSRDAKTYIARGITYHTIQKYQEAALDYQQALNINPNDFYVLNNLGLIAYEQNQILKALEYWQQARSLNLKPGETTLAFAVAMYQQGETDKAVEIATKVLSTNKQLSDLDFLREQLWGDKLTKDTRVLFSDERIKQLIN